MRTTRRQEDHETTKTGVTTTMVCHRMCDYHHCSPEEEERLTTMVTTTGEKAPGEGCHYDTMTRMTAMATTTQDRLQERSLDKRTTTSSDYVIRLTDRLLRLGSKISDCFSHGSRAGTTTRRDMATTRVAAASCNGTDYNNCDASTTATSTTGSDTESTTSADTDLQSTPTFTAVDNPVDLINPLSDDCTHYILTLGGWGLALKHHHLHHLLHLWQEQQPQLDHYQSCYLKLVYHNLQCLMVLHHPFRSGYKRPATS